MHGMRGPGNNCWSTKPLGKESALVGVLGGCGQRQHWLRSGHLRPFIHYTALPGCLENIFCTRVVGKIDLFLKSRDTSVFYLAHESPQTKWNIGVTNAQYCLEKRRAQRQHLVLSSRQSHRGADVSLAFYFLKTTLWAYGLPTINCTKLKHTNWWVLTDLFTH